MHDPGNIDKKDNDSHKPQGTHWCLRRQAHPESPKMWSVPCKVDAKMFGEETQVEFEIKHGKDFLKEITLNLIHLLVL